MTSPQQYILVVVVPSVLSAALLVWMQYVNLLPGALRQLRTVHHRALLRIIGPQHKRPDYRITSYSRAIEITRCKSIEKLRARRLLGAGALIRMSGGRLPNRVLFGNLEGAVRRGRGGKGNEGTDCVQSDIRAFGIAEDCKVTALEDEVWVETVTQGGRRLMAARRKGGRRG